jgi:glycosyltransferase involved in cell wall biosynthesis
MENQKSRRNMHLLVSGHFVQAGRVGGAEHMLYNLVYGLQNQHIETTLMCSRRIHLSPHFMRTIASSDNVRVLESGGEGTRFLAEQRACYTINLTSDAILFPNYYVPPLVPRRLGKTAVVIHDLQYRHFPQYFSLKKRIWLRAAQRFAIQRADKVIVISEFVRTDVIKWFGARGQHKIVVIPNAISWDRFNLTETTRPIAGSYVLAVAAQYPHKNLETLIRAFARVSKIDKEVSLVLVGQRYDGLHGVLNLQSPLDQLISSENLTERVRMTGYVDDLALAQWYRHAELFIFPSVFEGFGMPAVEALGLGLPTLTTRLTALPETTLGLAITVDQPMNDAEWADRILEILKKPERYRPSFKDVDRLRRTYDPNSIAEKYVTALSR